MSGSALYGVGITTHSAAASGTAFLGERDMITYTTMPENHPHDQQRKPPLEQIEGCSTAPVLLGLGGYMAVRKTFRFIRDLNDPE